MATSIHLRANNGMYVCAENGGGGVVNANRAIPAQWETFALIDPDGPPLVTGELVCFQTFSGNFFCAENGGGSTLNATRTMADGWESFKIVPATGGPSGGVITTGQQVAIQTATGNYVCAEGGGGGVVDANRTAIGPWETFTIELLGPAPIRAHQGPDMINNDNHQWMESWAIFSDSGIFSLETHTWTTKELAGFHGGVVAFMLDIAENIIANTPMYRYGVDGTWIPGKPSSQDVIQTPSFSRDIFEATGSINIYHKYDPSDQLIQDIDTLTYVGQTIGDAIKRIISAV